MPNTLAHLGAQALATRTVIRTAEVQWIFLGAVVPDVPWIAGRATRTLLPNLHDHDFWAYYIAQSSLVMSLLLCAAVAAIAARPGRAFVILGVNALFHLVLDGLQHRWGNGVHLLAPVSWESWNAGWFGLDSPAAFVLTGLGAVVAVVALLAIWRQRDTPALDLSRRRLAWAGVLLVLYVGLPVPLRHGPLAADTLSVGTLHDRSNRSGRTIALDRTFYRRDGDRQFIHTYGGDVLSVSNRPLDSDAVVSIRATFVNDTTLFVHDFRDHSGSPRDLLTYVGLAVVLASCVVASPVLKGRKQWGP